MLFFSFTKEHFTWKILRNLETNMTEVSVDQQLKSKERAATMSNKKEKKGVLRSLSFQVLRRFSLKNFIFYIYYHCFFFICQYPEGSSAYWSAWMKDPTVVEWTKGFLLPVIILLIILIFHNDSIYSEWYESKRQTSGRRIIRVYRKSVYCDMKTNKFILFLERCGF